METRLSLSRRHLRRDLAARGILPLAIVTARRPLRYRWHGGACSDFIAQLADLLEAGVPLLSALDLMANGHPHTEWRVLIHQLSRGLPMG